MINTERSYENILMVFLILASMTFVSVFVFDELVAPNMSLNIMFLQTIRVLIVLVITFATVFIIRRMKKRARILREVLGAIIKKT